MFVTAGADGFSVTFSVTSLASASSTSGEPLPKCLMRPTSGTRSETSSDGEMRSFIEDQWSGRFGDDMCHSLPPQDLNHTPNGSSPVESRSQTTPSSTTLILCMRHDGPF